MFLTMSAVSKKLSTARRLAALASKTISARPLSTPAAAASALEIAERGRAAGIKFFQFSYVDLFGVQVIRWSSNPGAARIPRPHRVGSLRSLLLSPLRSLLASTDPHRPALLPSPLR